MTLGLGDMWSDLIENWNNIRTKTRSLERFCPPLTRLSIIVEKTHQVMGLTTVQQQSSDVVTHHSCTIQQSCEPAPMVAKECAGCGKRIVERYLLKALDIFWHEDCLKCGCCDCRLGEVGSTLYIKANLILCKRDYLRLFGNTGSCSACNKMIPAYEMVMRAKYNVYHLECFACFACQHRWGSRSSAAEWLRLRVGGASPLESSHPPWLH
jgi:LIM domain